MPLAKAAPAELGAVPHATVGLSLLESLPPHLHDCERATMTTMLVVKLVSTTAAVSVQPVCGLLADRIGQLT
jgi:hypothetical protein